MKEVICLAPSIGMFIFLMFSNILHVGRGQPCADEVWYLLEGNRSNFRSKHLLLEGKAYELSRI
jgi:hypothetical protein